MNDWMINAGKSETVCKISREQEKKKKKTIKNEDSLIIYRKARLPQT